MRNPKLLKVWDCLEASIFKGIAKTFPSVSSRGMREVGEKQRRDEGKEDSSAFKKHKELQCAFIFSPISHNFIIQEKKN